MPARDRSPVSSSAEEPGSGTAWTVADQLSTRPTKLWPIELLVLPARVLAECGEVDDARRAAAAVAWLADRLDVPLANFGAHVQHARIAALKSDRRGQVQHLRRAAALADSADLRDAPPELEPTLYDAWAEPVRQRAEDCIATASLMLLDGMAASGDSSGALELEMRLVERRPADEVLWTRLVELRLAAGDRAGARRALNDARSALERELGPGADRVLSSGVAPQRNSSGFESLPLESGSYAFSLPRSLFSN